MGSDGMQITIPGMSHILLFRSKTLLLTTGVQILMTTMTIGPRSLGKGTSRRASGATRALDWSPLPS